MSALWIGGGLAVFLVVVCGTCYGGAGVILSPPKKAPMNVFPELFGLKAEKVSFQTRDGLTLKGWFIPSAKGDPRTILMCHGWGDNKGFLLERTHFMADPGEFNLFYFDNRAHGESEGEITTIGFLETIDFEAALRYLKEHRPNPWPGWECSACPWGPRSVMAMPDHPELKAATGKPLPVLPQRGAALGLSTCAFLISSSSWSVLENPVGDPWVDQYSPVRFIKKIAPRPLFLIGAAR